VTVGIMDDWRAVPHLLFCGPGSVVGALRTGGGTGTPGPGNLVEQSSAAILVWDRHEIRILVGELYDSQLRSWRAVEPHRSALVLWRWETAMKPVAARLVSARVGNRYLLSDTLSGQASGHRPRN